MTIIEGIGDEVVQIIIGIIVILLSILAWWSTHIREVAFYRTIVIVERNSRHNNNNNSNVIDNNQVVEPLGGLQVTRSVHTTLTTSEESTSQSSLPIIQDPASSATSSLPASSPPTSTEDLNSNEKIRIRLKYLNDEEKIVDGKLTESLAEFKMRHFHSELNSNNVVRLIYNGHLLQQDNSTLGTCGIFNNCVIHCLVHPRRNQPNSHESSQRFNNQNNNNNNSSNVNNENINNGSSSRNTNDSWGDVGGIFYALVTTILCSVWYWRFQHSHLFSFTATAALTSITAIFSIFIFSMTFHPNNEIPVEVM